MSTFWQRQGFGDFANPMRGVVYGPLGTVLAAVGTAVSAAGTISAGNSAAALGEWQAKQLVEKGKAEKAAASVEAENLAKQKRLVASRAQAVGAASGGGQDINLLGQIEEEGTLRSLMAIWRGEEAAKGRKIQAAAARFEGKAKKKASYLDAAGTLLSGGSTFYDNYSQGTP